MSIESVAVGCEAAPESLHPTGGQPSPESVVEAMRESGTLPMIPFDWQSDLARCYAEDRSIVDRIETPHSAVYRLGFLAAWLALAERIRCGG